MIKKKSSVKWVLVGLLHSVLVFAAHAQQGGSPSSGQNGNQPFFRLGFMGGGAFRFPHSGAPFGQGFNPAFGSNFGGPQSPFFRANVYGASLAGAANNAAMVSRLTLNPGSPFLNSVNPYGSMNPFDSLSPYGGSNPYGGFGLPGSYPIDLNGPYLQGASAVIQSQATYLTSYQQANLLKEQALREKIENRQKLMEQWLWQREHMPTAQDERDRAQKTELRRARFNPPVTEIYSAKSLNDLLGHLQTLPNDKGSENEFKLDEDLLALVNVTPPGRNGNVGLLKKDGKLIIPSVLQREEFKDPLTRLTPLFTDAIRQAGRGQVGPNTLADLRSAADQLQKTLRNRIEDYPPSQHIEARRFLNQLEDSLKVLGHADVASHFNGTYAAKGRSVPELVRNMKDKGLHFAPAVDGNEAAYAALYQALVNYEQATSTQLRAQETRPNVPQADGEAAKNQRPQK